MPRLMDMGLEKLTGYLNEMATISQDAVEAAIRAYDKGEKGILVEKQSELLRSLHSQVSELAIELIARYQPVATDLRYIKACFEISYGYFRFGRYAHDIVEVLEMLGDVTACDHKPVLDTAKKAQEMMKMSIDAFQRRDVEVARKIPRMDDVVDERYRSYLERVIGSKDADLRCTLSATLILRYLERIADHATYIGDSVVYIVTGVAPPA